MSVLQRASQSSYRENHYEKMAEYIRHFRVLCWTNMVIIKLKNKIWDWYDNIWFRGSSEGTSRKFNT